jgi:release factor glutamine methyltransferase
MPTTAFHNVTMLTAPGRVMTPRPATERLVDRALELVRPGPMSIADVGTGSGAIAVTLGLLVPEAEIWATDVSVRAAELAARNAARHGVGGRVHVVAGDLLDPVPGDLDLVVANLPYLPSALRGRPEYADLELEPSAAVFAAGDGLGPYRRLLEAARTRLRPNGRVLLQYRAGLYEAGRDELDDLAATLTDEAALAKAA